MPIEAIIRHDPPQVRVAHEQHPKEIVHLPLIPIRTIVEARNAGDGRGLVRIGLDPNARVVTDGEEVVDNLEAVAAGRVVHGCYVADLRVLCRRVVLEEGEDGQDGRGRDEDCQLVLPDAELLDVFRQGGD